MNISDTIKRIRESKRIPQASIAESLEMDRANYNKLEKRGSKMTIEQLQSIADALEVSILDILGIIPQLDKELQKQVQEQTIAMAAKDKQIEVIVSLTESLKELSDLNEKYLNIQIKNLVWTQYKHETAFGLAAEEIEGTYGVDLFAYDNKDPASIQQEVWFQPFIEKYRILLITVISTNLLGLVNQTLLKCFLDAMQPLSHSESMLFDRFDIIALSEKGIKVFNTRHTHGVSAPTSEQNTLGK